MKAIVCRKREREEEVCEVETWSKMEARKTARCIYSVLRDPSLQRKPLCRPHAREMRGQRKSGLLLISGAVIKGASDEADLSR